MLILFICLIVLSKVFYPKNNSVSAGMQGKDADGIYAEPENTIDVLIVGNSEAYTSIIPMEIWKKYGYTSYICGYPDQTLPMTIRYLHEATKTQKPKIIVWEANNTFKVTKINEPVDQMLNYTFKIFQYHNRWKTLTGEDFTTSPNMNTINHLKGYNFSNDAKAVKKNQKEDKGKSGIAISNKVYINYMKDFCESRGIKFIALTSPIKRFWGERNNMALQKYFGDNKIEYLNLNNYQEEIGIDWEKDTRDQGDHLNYSGALKVTKFFGEYLDKLNILTNHKDDENYSSWDNSYEEYKKIVATE